MSKKCEHCGTHIRSYFTYTTPTTRHDDATGFTYRFCSDVCANQWVARRQETPCPPRHAGLARLEEDRQAEQRWLGDGGAMGPRA